ncbi:unnamed protein product [Alopecurus aequalis]
MEACFPCLGARKNRMPPPPVEPTPAAAAARTFSFEELAAATRGFRDRVAGEEPCVYRGHLKSVNQVVAMKLQHIVDDTRLTEQRNSEFLARVLMLNALRHPNLVGLVGFCADGSHRILVHEHVPLGSLDDHLHDPSPNKAPLDWSTRMNVAVGVARALEYLHEKGAVYLCLRSSDILLGDGYRPKMSHYGLAKAGQLYQDHVEARAFAREPIGCLAPETVETGYLSAASDVYSFGAVLLELITGRRAFNRRAAEEDRHLVAWARPLLRDRVEFRRMADPALQGRYPSMDLEAALTVASMCIKRNRAMRTPIGAVVTTLARLAHDQPS